MGFLKRHQGKLTLSVIITGCVWYTLHKGGLKIVPEGGAHYRAEQTWPISRHWGTSR